MILQHLSGFLPGNLYLLKDYSISSFWADSRIPASYKLFET